MTRLNVEELEVTTFETTIRPAEPTFTAVDPNPVVWTGCLSDCTQCGTGGTIFTMEPQVQF